MGLLNTPIPNTPGTFLDMPIPKVAISGILVSLPITTKAMPMIAFTRTRVQYSRRRARPRKPA